ncbi:GNAT family N-acetyltransferase [Xanthomarina sp.]|uniref:GNAT family N-acetyltransferase n=1 Tax=Xanthomarina sp. TaxID=1931211 RepID=UPI002B6C0727|nr:GNAT family N-acetyltransferase [Xanthomarina sp.]HLV37958.1 GNAT family N-acetyltransferase [Xanthomarina sp.]
MSYNNIVIREISVADNKQMAQVIRDVLVELGAPKVGTAYEDVSLDKMTETYRSEKSAYFVIEREGKILGGAGVAPLVGCEDQICELQKMYFLPEARGLGLGEEMMQKCLESAKAFGYKKCYLETLPYMKDAKKLYNKVGFESLDKPMGNTGHYSCNVWMIKAL